MFTVLSRIVHLGFKNFWRNILVSTATVAVLTLSLFVFAGLVFANVVTQNLINYVKDKIDISVYFKINSPEDEILNIRQSLEKLPEVKSVEYISADQALEIFKASHANDPSINQSISELGTNPLEASLNVKAKDPSKYVTIAGYLDSQNLSQYIDNVSYSKNQTVIDRLASLISNVNRGGIILTIILALIAGLVMFNTIWLAIYSNRDEIGIMRVVGASNFFIRGPYIVQGIIGGALASVLSLIFLLILFLTAPLVYKNYGYFDISIPNFSLTSYFYLHLGQIFLYQLILGVLVAAVSSFVAVRRYLRN